ncbi:MAG TPA: DUF3501 family protein [Kofleriaceae bacterium]|jgi:hypothetical protein|nr:DUF3501 family protein [Kofleriaceae bacterium]
MSNFVRPIRRDDIKGPAIYAHIRDDYRNRIIELKKARRVLLGDIVEMVFDNRLTLTMQIEEICRLENLTRDDQIEEEIRINNELMPTESSLAATIFITLPNSDPNTPERMRELVGLDEHVILKIGPHTIRAEFEKGRSTDEKISAVQYTRYPLSPEAKQSLLTPGTPIEVEIDHPAYRHRVQCSEDMRASLAADYGD